MWYIIKSRASDSLLKKKKKKKNKNKTNNKKNKEGSGYQCPAI